ncbi:MAG: TlpA family protein disulfide reductase [Pirellulales bacterium]
MNDNSIPFFHPTRIAICAVVGLLLTGAAGRASDAPLRGTLVWKNGDRLDGELLGATATHLTWQSPLFAEPFELDLRFLQSVASPWNDKQPEITEPLRIVLRNDDLMYGHLIGITDDHFVLDVRHAGRVEIARPAVRSFRQLDNLALIYDGPRGIEGWRTLHGAQRIADWTADSNGHLTTKVLGAELFRVIKLPTVSELNVSLSWQGKPGFLITFAAPRAIRATTEAVKLETWDDQLVLQTLATNGDFVQLMTLTKETHRIDLRLLWNQQSGELAVYQQKGPRLGKMVAGASNQKGQPGLYIQNKGSDLTLRRLQVSSWNGTLPPDLAGQETGGRCQIQVVDGRTIDAHIRAYDRASESLIVDLPSGEEDRIALSRVAGIDLGEEPERTSQNSAGRRPRPENSAVRRSLGTGAKSLSQDKKAPSPNPSRASGRGGFGIGSKTGQPVPDAPSHVALNYADGTRIRGTLESSDGGTMVLRLDYCDRSMACRLDGVLRLRIGNSEDAPSPGTPAQLHMDTTTLHGRLAPAGTAIGWQPVGSRTASRLPEGRSVRIVRTTDGGKDDSIDKDSSASEPFTDVIYLRGGDVVPCHILVIDKTHVHVEFGFSQIEAVPSRHVKAVEFNMGALHLSTGFGGAAWNVTAENEDAVERTEEQVVFHGPASIGHRDLLRYNEISFDIRWNSSVVAPLTISLFTRNGQRKGGAASLLVYCAGRQLVFQGLRPQRGGRRAVAQALVGRNGPRANRAKITLSLRKQEIAVLVDGKVAFRLPTDDAERSGRGFVLTVQQVGRRGRGLQKMPAELLTVSNLRARRTCQVDGSPDVSEEKKEHLLTLPRGGKHNRPTHVLLADNGDLLRGRLSALTDHAAGFTSRMEDFSISRDRLAGIVWLADVDEEASRARGNADDPLVAIFTGGMRCTFTANRMVGSHIVGHHPVLGECRVPMDLLQELQLGPAARRGELTAYADWRLRPAEEPKFAAVATAGDNLDAKGPPGTKSPLVGATSPPLAVELVGGGQFCLEDHADRVVVLDFWASWCGPCVRALPETIATVNEFPSDKVRLVAVNQLEAEEAISAFLEARQWDVAVGLDLEGDISRAFQVEVIPQTVVIGPDGKVERVFIGAQLGLQKELKQVLKRLTTSP